jgi:transcriptional regulator with XRE-family HTH domain/tetratricopeptide (TPR) repeat protein
VSSSQIVIPDQGEVGTVERDVWERLDMRAALAVHDIGEVYRLLGQAGITQVKISQMTGQSQSEVSEIIKGRRVMAYDVLERIANGLGIPRGYLGLAYDEGCQLSAPPEEEVDEEMKRRALLAAGGMVAFGAPVFGVPDPSALTFRDVITNPPSHIGMPDVETYEQVVTRLGMVDRAAGGIAAREALAAIARGGEEMLGARCTEPVRQRLLGAVSEAHRLAGWASGDVGLIDQCRWHMHRAIDHAQGQQERLAGVLASAGDMEKHYGAPNDALKFFQLGTAGLPADADPQSGAVLHGLAASAYLTMGHQEQARSSLANARAMFADAPDPDSSLPFFAFYGPGHGLLAATGGKLANYEAARTDVQRALDLRPDYDVRCRAFDTIVLATILINAGEIRDGISETRRALDLVTMVGSQRVRDRLEPLESALSIRRDSTCQDLARQVRVLRAPAVAGA